MDTDTTILAVISTEHEYTRQVLVGLRQYELENPNVRLRVCDCGVNTMASLPELLERHSVAGIVAYTARPHVAQAVVASGLPAVNFSINPTPCDLPNVVIDNAAVGVAAADHLMGLGLRHFAYFGLDVRYAHDRFAGFSQRLADAGFEAPAFTGYRAWMSVEKLMQLPRPIGVFCVEDRIGRELIDHLENHEVHVPDECAIIAAGNSVDACDLGPVTLSSIDLAGREVGGRAAAAVVSMIRGREPRFPIRVRPGQRIQRESTDTIACRIPQIVHAIRYLRTNACSGIDVSNVVAASGLSRSTVDRQITAVLGHTPHQEIRRLQLQRARRLLVETDLAIAVIAQRTGFDDPDYFVRVFRKHHDCTPTQFRVHRRTYADE